LRTLDAIDVFTVHHTVSPNREWSEAEELVHVKQIYAGHMAEGHFTAGWSAPGIGYNWLCFPSGRIYYVGSINTVRAAVANENDHTVAAALVGTFTDENPTDEVLIAVKYLKENVEETLGRSLVVRPHRFYGGTACPGNTYAEWIGVISGL
jgi:N-acetylmuramoyl-L-alanine amidase-like protein